MNSKIYLVAIWLILLLILTQASDSKASQTAKIIISGRKGYVTLKANLQNESQQNPSTLNAVSNFTNILTKGIQNQKLFNWIKPHFSSKTRLPLSFYIPKNKKKHIYKKIGKADSLTGIIERIIIEEGLSIYDGALNQIILTHAGGQENLNQAYKPLEIYWEGKVGKLVNIRAGYPGQPYIYDHNNPEIVSSELTNKGRRGFLFRIINANGNYDTADPLDGKRRFESFPNWPTVHWEDWKPIAGENAWVVLAALHLYNKKYFNTDQQIYEHNRKAIELLLAKEIARAAIILQSEVGGVRMAPLGTYYSLSDIDHTASIEKIAQQLDEFSIQQDYVTKELLETKKEQIAGKEFPDFLVWYYYEISTENNLSWYAAFRMLYQIDPNPIYKEAMNRIESYFKTVWNPDENYFYQGMHYTDGEWLPNTEFFASDVQNWALAVIGPDIIDSWFGIGTAYNIWKTTKSYSGVRDNHGRVLGVGYTKENDRLSIEWTSGAILATRLLASYYKKNNPVWSQELQADAASMRNGIEAYRIDIAHDQAAYAYSSKRGWIPFGWFSLDPDVLSMASTCWVFLIDNQINPFILSSQ